MTAVRTAVWPAVLVAGLAMASDVQVDARRVYSAELRDSVLRVPPLLRDRWLEDRRLTSQSDRQYRAPETTGLRLVGKWGRGPSIEVAGQDSIVALALGSEAALVSIADPAQPRVLSEVQFDYLAKQVWLRDTLLVAAANGVELWNVAIPTEPRQLSVIPCRVRDFFARDTLLFLVYADTFRVFSIANPRAPRLLGTCRASGEATAGNDSIVALLTTGGLTLVDVRDPQAPALAAAYAGDVWSADIRGNLCCVALSDPNNPSISWTVTLDIANPYAPRQLGRLNNACGEDMQLAGQYCFLSGRSDGEEEFQVVGIADSTSPVLVGACYVPRANRGVWVNLQRELACVAADPMGLATIDLGNIGSPTLITHTLHADLALDIHVDGNRAYVADYRAGLRILDVTDPARPTELGGYDSTPGSTESVVARDSFACSSWWYPYFRAYDVSPPESISPAGHCNVFDPPSDMVLRDTLVYCAMYARFQVVNVARPREPRLVGSCVVGEFSEGLTVRDTLAFVGNSPVAIVSIAQPTNPRVIGTIARGAWNVSLRDTFAFLPSGGVLVYSIADPSQPRVLDSISVGPNTYWVEAVGTLLYTGNRDGVRALDVTDIHNMRVIGFAPTPYSVTRLHYAPPYVYAACWDAGVCIFESSQVAIGAEGARLAGLGDIRVIPNPTSSGVWLSGYPEGKGEALVRDALGREVLRVGLSTSGRRVRLDLGGVSAGVYFVEVRTTAGAVGRARLVKR